MPFSCEKIAAEQQESQQHPDRRPPQQAQHGKQPPATAAQAIKEGQREKAGEQALRKKAGECAEHHGKRKKYIDAEHHAARTRALLFAQGAPTESPQKAAAHAEIHQTDRPDDEQTDIAAQHARPRKVRQVEGEEI